MTVHPFVMHPTLPQGENKVRFLDDGTGAEDTGDGSSQASGPVLYGYNPVRNELPVREEEALTESSDYLPNQTAPLLPRRSMQSYGNYLDAVGQF